MKIDFTKLAEVTPEFLAVLQDTKVAAFIDEQTESGISAQVTAQGAIKDAELATSKATFKTNMDALDTKLKTAEANLAAQLAKKTGSATDDDVKAAQLKVTELTSQLDALGTDHDTLKATSEKGKNDLQKLRHKITIGEAIKSFNSTNKEIQVGADTAEVVEMLAERYVESAEEGYKVTRFDGQPLTTAKGLGTPADWLDYLHTEKPGLFTTPTGSRAPGQGGNTGGGATQMTRADFDALPHADKAAAAEKNTII